MKAKGRWKKANCDSIMNEKSRYSFVHDDLPIQSINLRRLVYGGLQVLKDDRFTAMSAEC